MNPEVFQQPEKLHLTLGVLRIFTPEEEVCPMTLHLPNIECSLFSQERAKAVVKGAISEAKYNAGIHLHSTYVTFPRPLLGSLPVVICVEGVDTMKDDPTAVDVLFARVFLTDKSDRSLVPLSVYRVSSHGWLMQAPSICGCSAGSCNGEGP